MKNILFIVGSLRQGSLTTKWLRKQKASGRKSNSDLLGLQGHPDDEPRFGKRQPCQQCKKRVMQSLRRMHLDLLTSL